MTDSLPAFVRTGDPNCTSLPNRPLFTVDKREMMVLNDVCEVKNDPDREARNFLK